LLCALKIALRRMVKTDVKELIRRQGSDCVDPISNPSRGNRTATARRRHKVKDRDCEG
jgi:hypothetical protein